MNDIGSLDVMRLRPSGEWKNLAVLNFEPARATIKATEKIGAIRMEQAFEARDVETGRIVHGKEGDCLVRDHEGMVKLLPGEQFDETYALDGDEQPELDKFISAVVEKYNELVPEERQEYLDGLLVDKYERIDHLTKVRDSQERWLNEAVKALGKEQGYKYEDIAKDITALRELKGKKDADKSKPDKAPGKKRPAGDNSKPKVERGGVEPAGGVAPKKGKGRKSRNKSK